MSSVEFRLLLQKIDSERLRVRSNDYIDFEFKSMAAIMNAVSGNRDAVLSRINALVAYRKEVWDTLDGTVKKAETEEISDDSKVAFLAALSNSAGQLTSFADTLTHINKIAESVADNAKHNPE